METAPLVGGEGGGWCESGTITKEISELGENRSRRL